MSETDLERVKQEYETGKDEFERGNYRLSVKHLDIAAGLVDRSSRLGGEILLWLVTAQEAMGNRTEAISLCKQLTKHPTLKTREQARRLIYILEAPKLNTRPEWLMKIPDMTTLEKGQSLIGQVDQVKPPSKPPRHLTIPDPIDPSKVNTKDNQFLWVALLGLTLIVVFYLSI